MGENFVVGAGIAAAILLASGTGVLVGIPTALGLTPLGVAIYAIVAVGIPQAILANADGSRLRVAVAGLAIASGVGMLGVGLVRGTVTTQHSPWFGSVLLASLVLAFASGTLRSFYEGYQTASR